MKHLLFLFAASLSIATTFSQEKVKSISALRLLGTTELRYNMFYKGSTVGGLSGIDYDSKNELYYMISDDRSAISPARYYTAKIYFTPKGIDSVSITGVTRLLQQDGKIYPNSMQDPVHTPDPEALRYDPVHDRMIWSSEGERIVKTKDTVLENPSINIITPDGKYVDTFSLPVNLYMHATENGPRQNGVLEGLTFADNYKTLFVSLEEPRYEDGPRADTFDNNAWTRIYKFDTKTKKNTAQYAYKLEPVAHMPSPPTAFKINGIPDILSMGDDKMLVMERSFSTGRLACTIRIFLADLKNAADISSIGSLKNQPPANPVVKKLLLNMDELGMYIDNVEGMTFGPTLPNGHKTLLMVADNNFAQLEKTQIFLFEVMP